MTFLQIYSTNFIIGASTVSSYLVISTSVLSVCVCIYLSYVLLKEDKCNQSKKSQASLCVELEITAGKWSLHYSYS